MTRPNSFSLYLIVCIFLLFCHFIAYLSCSISPNMPHTNWFLAITLFFCFTRFPNFLLYGCNVVFALFLQNRLITKTTRPIDPISSTHHYLVVWSSLSFQFHRQADPIVFSFSLAIIFICSVLTKLIISSPHQLQQQRPSFNNVICCLSSSLRLHLKLHATQAVFRRCTAMYFSRLLAACVCVFHIRFTW